MFTKNLRFFGEILHPQWPAQTPNMGPKMNFVLYRLRRMESVMLYIITLKILVLN
jgi:hypothetical protein